MNKKTIIFAPLAVLTLGLTSCNKSWPTINKDDAAVKERIDAVLKMKSSLQDKTEFPKTVVMNFKEKYTESYKNHNITSETTNERKYDIENKYVVTSSKRVESNVTYNDKAYQIYQDNVSYSLYPYSYRGTKNTATTEDLWKSNTKSYILDGFNHFGVYNRFYALSSYEDVISAWDKENELDTQVDGYFKYTFITNDKTKNIGFIIEKKWSYDPGNAGKISYEEKTEYRYENNLPTYIATTLTESTEAFKEEPAYAEKTESTATISYDQKIGQDKINLSDYYIEEGSSI